MNSAVAAVLEATSMKFIMGGSIPNAEIALQGSTEALVNISECMEAAKKVDLTTPAPAPTTPIKPKTSA